MIALIKSVFHSKKVLFVIPILLLIGIGLAGYSFFLRNQLNSSVVALKNSKQELETLKQTDQYQINTKLTKEIKNIEEIYSQSLSIYEKLIDLKGSNSKFLKYDQTYASSIQLLSQKKFASASALLTDLGKIITEEQAKSAQAVNIPDNVTVSNTPPTSGFSNQKVSVDNQDFLVKIVSADLSSTKVIVDTASESDCNNNCPAISLAEYVSRNGAYAGINGSFFCPPEYPSCSGKTNSFDTLLMNKNKRYFNSDNNVYSTIPAAIFSAGFARFVGKSQDWGRDTSPDSVIANYPLLVSGDQINFSENPNEPKFGAKGARTFIAAKGNNVYIGVIYNATMGESAKVLKAMGMRDALNLDEGGSTALWFGGYKAGPGRNVPNAVLFVKR